MILCPIGQSALYDAVHPGLAKAMKWLREQTDANFAKGNIEIGDGIVVKCEEPSLMPRESVKLEAHCKFIDIHVPLKGTEIIGWGPTDSLQYIHTPYDEERDVAFYGDAAHSLLHVKRGQMAVFFPEDAHAPNIGLGTHRKLCIKIPV